MFKTTLHNLARDDRGATAIEYGLIVAMIAIACIAAFDKLGNGANGSLAGVMGKIGSVLF
ncbi:pilus assembly protein Flp/PilA [Novosphingobium kunmingense]|uniref:Pilus assembly protein Flp/PilA n=1 Tax=Novosphingobium kunmingense TaxID=1211806 RepID=A0A2N0I3C2_9SPHN|nr:Flp family type IVb pilin [Novosphingobium kunmingense]PKB25677.1 pilus assembly protein Flp/PilA [Novosphingobium kunmingense]